MVKIKEFDVKNEINEFTIQEFENVSRILNEEEVEKFERWANLFIYLGVPESELYDLDFTEFVECVKLFSETKVKPSSEFCKVIELDGYTYTSHEDELKISVREMKMIEKQVSNNPHHYISYLMLVLFKRNDLTKVEHYTDAHIKQKAKLFSSLSAELAIPYATFIGLKLSNRIENAPTEVLD
jgi:hypothetical protein